MDAYRGITQYTELECIGITRGSVARLEKAKGACLRVEHGAVWVTQEGSIEDVYLSAGDSFAVQNDGKTLISTLTSRIALVSVEQPAKQCFASRFWNCWASLYADTTPRFCL